MSNGTQHLADRVAITEALAEIATCLDLRDWDGLAARFTADTHAYGVDGVTALIPHIQQFLGGVGRTQHLLGNHRITVDGDTARSQTSFRAYHLGAGPKEGATYECLGEYDDQWQRTSVGWVIGRRDIEVWINIGDFTVLRPADQ